MESGDAGPTLRFDDGSTFTWVVERAGDLSPPRMQPGARVDVDYFLNVRPANPYGRLVQSTTLLVQEADGGQPLWVSRGGYFIGQALGNDEVVNLFGLAPTFRAKCADAFNACWTFTRTTFVHELATVPATVVQPNEKTVIHSPKGTWEVRWVHAIDEGSHAHSCTQVDGVEPNADATFAGSFQGP